MAGGRTLWDQLIAGTGDAIADIREKLVEEPWYGRALDVPVSELAAPSQLRYPDEGNSTSHPASMPQPAREHDDGIER